MRAVAARHTPPPPPVATNHAPRGTHHKSPTAATRPRRAWRGAGADVIVPLFRCGTDRCVWGSGQRAVHARSQAARCCYLPGSPLTLSCAHAHAHTLPWDGPPRSWRAGTSNPSRTAPTCPGHNCARFSRRACRDSPSARIGVRARVRARRQLGAPRKRVRGHGAHMQKGPDTKHRHADHQNATANRSREV